MRSTDPNVPATAYRITGGIGTRQIGLFRASTYFGYQGSGASTPDTGGRRRIRRNLELLPDTALDHQR